MTLAYREAMARLAAKTTAAPDTERKQQFAGLIAITIEGGRIIAAKRAVFTGPMEQSRYPAAASVNAD
ncbi:MAG TPA: hypothetical protein VFA39_07860 [Steroidobacteraceae bacterium]|nr:hypothetical protein [Steroidobacteraceae bacterium]